MHSHHSANPNRRSGCHDGTHTEDCDHEEVVNPAGNPTSGVKKTLILFLDNLHVDSIDENSMPFINSLSESSEAHRVETVLGYSNAIRNTIFTGATPRQHGKWSKFKFDPEKSPFKSMGAYKAIDLLPGSFLQRCARFACSRTILKAQGRRKGYSQLSFENVPMNLLPNFDFTEEDITKEAGNAATIFDVFREHQVPFAYLSLPLKLGGDHLKRVEKALEANDVVVVYVYNLDAAGHWFGVESPRYVTTQQYTDRFLQAVNSRAQNAWGTSYQTFVFSDHGMSTVTGHINLVKHLKKVSPGFQRDYLCFVDSTMARLWYRNDRGRAEARYVFDQLGKGKFLTDEDRKRFGVDFPSTDYGEDVYLLDHDTVFFPAYVSWLKPTGMHGFSCDHPSQDGTFIWHDGAGPHSLPKRVHMTDLAPTILGSLGLTIPDTSEGRRFR